MSKDADTVSAPVTTRKTRKRKTNEKSSFDDDLVMKCFKMKRCRVDIARLVDQTSLKEEHKEDKMEEAIQEKNDSEVAQEPDVINAELPSEHGIDKDIPNSVVTDEPKKKGRPKKICKVEDLKEQTNPMESDCTADNLENNSLVATKKPDDKSKPSEAPESLVAIKDVLFSEEDIVDGQHGVKLKKAPQHIDGEDIVDDSKFVQNQEKASDDETGPNKVEDAPMELRKRTRSQGLRKTIPRESKKIRVDDTSVAVAPEGDPKDDCNTENIIISNLETNKSGQNTTVEEKTVCNVIEMESEVNISTHDSVKIASQDTQDSVQEANVQKDLEDIVSMDILLKYQDVIKEKKEDGKSHQIDSEKECLVSADWVSLPWQKPRSSTPISATTGPYRCTGCDYTCKSTSYFTKHWNFKHLSDTELEKATFMCTTTSTKLTILGVNKVVYQCKMCSAARCGINSTNAQTGMKKHMENKHMQQLKAAEELSSLYKVVQDLSMETEEAVGEDVVMEQDKVMEQDEAIEKDEAIGEDVVMEQDSVIEKNEAMLEDVVIQNDEVIKKVDIIEKGDIIEKDEVIEKGEVIKKDEVIKKKDNIKKGNFSKRYEAVEKVEIIKKDEVIKKDDVLIEQDKVVDHDFTERTVVEELPKDKMRSLRPDINFNLNTKSFEYVSFDPRCLLYQNTVLPQEVPEDIMETFTCDISLADILDRARQAKLLEGQELENFLAGKDQGRSRRGRSNGNLKVQLVKDVKKELVEAFEDDNMTKSLYAPLTKKEKLLRTKRLLLKEVKKEAMEVTKAPLASVDDDIVVTKSIPAPLAKKEKLLRTKQLLLKEVKKEALEVTEAHLASDDDDIVVMKSIPAPLAKKEKLLVTKVKNEPMEVIETTTKAPLTKEEKLLRTKQLLGILPTTSRMKSVLEDKSPDKEPKGVVFEEELLDVFSEDEEETIEENDETIPTDSVPSPSQPAQPGFLIFSTLNTGIKSENVVDKITDDISVVHDTLDELSDYEDDSDDELEVINEVSGADNGVVKLRMNAIKIERPESVGKE